MIHFMHGNGYCGLAYAPLLRRLAADFDLFIPEAEGHGDSDHGGRFHGWNRTAEFALEAWHAHANLDGRGMFRGWREDAFQAYIDHALRDVPGGGVELKRRPTREAEIFASYPRRLWAALGRIAQPSLVLRGLDCFPFAARAIQHGAAMRPSVECRVLPGGHCFMQENPEASAGKIRAFLLAK